MIKGIINVLAYFNSFNYPLTLQQVHHGQFKYNKDDNLSINIEETKQELDKMAKKGFIDKKEGMYFFAGREKLLKIRQRRYMLAQLKYKKAKRAIRLLSLLPFIRFIGVCNTLAYNNAKAESDIDLFIFTKPGKIWTARFFSAGLMQLLHWRPTETKMKNTICLSFFVSQNNLNLEPVALSNDIYLYYWITEVVPIYDADNYYKNFLDSNQWVREKLPSYLSYETNPVRRLEKKWWQRLVQSVFEFIFGFGFWEVVLKKIQFAILPTNLKNLMNKDKRVVLNDKMLKFHDEDMRDQYRSEFEINRVDLLNIMKNE